MTPTPITELRQDAHAFRRAFATQAHNADPVLGGSLLKPEHSLQKHGRKCFAAMMEQEQITERWDSSFKWGARPFARSSASLGHFASLAHSSVIVWPFLAPFA